MITIDHINKSIQGADNLKSKLPIEISQMDGGFSSQKIRHLLNNLCSLDGCKYLNVGLACGSSYWSAIFNNNLKATGIDWWRGEQSCKDTERIFFEKLTKVITLEKEPLDRILEICNYDSFKIKLNEKYNIYLYDGDHSENGQYKALVDFDKYLEDEFILLVDDWDDIHVKNGTKKAIQELKYNVKCFWEGAGQFGNWDVKSSTWWNGFLVCLINKKTSLNLIDI